MANTIKHKQSSVAGKAPTAAQLDLGELSINTTDGKLFLKKSVSGTESVVNIGSFAAMPDKPTTLAGYGIADGVQANRASATFTTTANGWYRIATSAVGIARNSGVFVVDWAVSGQHGCVRFEAGCHYGRADGTSISQQGVSFYNTGGVVGARVVYHTTYTGNYAYVEVKFAAALTSVVVGVELQNALGWSLVAPSTAGGIPTGYAALYHVFVKPVQATAGTYAKVTVNQEGRVTAGSGLDTTDILQPVTGDWFNYGFVSISAGGVSEMGRYIDWHYNGSDTTDYTARTEIDANGHLKHSKDVVTKGALKGSSIVVEGTAPTIHLKDSDATENNFWLHANSSKFYILSDQDNDGSFEVPHALVLDNANDSLTVYGNTVWHTGNDGTGSGLDADLLDGQHGSYYLSWANLTGKPTTLAGYGITDAVSSTGNAASATKLATARTINDVSFDGSANIIVADSTKLPLAGGTMTGAITFAGAQTWPTFNQSTTGSAASLTTARTLTIGSTGKTFNGTADVSWTVAEIGAAAATHSHTQPVSGNLFNGGFLSISAAGVVEAGRYFDWHFASTDTNDYTARTQLESTGDLIHSQGLKVKGTGGLGYAFGGAVTQLTSRDTGVTLDTPSGRITLASVAVTAGTRNKFTLTNSCIAATDVVVVSMQAPGAGTFVVSVNQVAAGSCDIVIQNLDTITAAAPSLNFAIIKGSNS